MLRVQRYFRSKVDFVRKLSVLTKANGFFHLFLMSRCRGTVLILVAYTLTYLCCRNMSGGASTMRFHNHRGTNIVFTEDQQVALRKTSFAHAITFSARPLRPMEIFLVEIEKNESGWSGHMRIGLTMHNPNNNFQLPQYALPDLANQGKTWVYAVTKSHNKVVDTQVGEITLTHSLLGTGDSIRTFNGTIERSLLRPAPRLVYSKPLKKKPENERNVSIDARMEYAAMEKMEELEGAVGGVGISDIPDMDFGQPSFQEKYAPAPSFMEPSMSRNVSLQPSSSVPAYHTHGHTERRPEPKQRQSIYQTQNELAGYSAYGGPESVLVPQYLAERPARPSSPVVYEPQDVQLVHRDEQVLPTDEGSRIGIVYVVKGNRAEMHFIINGEDQGPCTRDIPYQDGPLFALVDVYGTTKQIRLIQLGSGE